MNPNDNDKNVSEYYDPTPNSDLPETIQAFTPLGIAICATAIAIAAVLSTASDSVKIAFAGAAGTGLGAAAGRLGSHIRPDDRKVNRISKADNVDVNL